MKKTFKWTVGCCAVALLASCAELGLFSGGSPDMKITEQGKAAAWISLDAKATEPEKLAAKELQDYIKKISGASIPTTKTEGALEIHLGCLADSKGSVPQDILDKLEQTQKEEAFYLKSEGDKLFIVGKTPVAALYGAYTLLEMMGVRWFYPGELGEYYPRNPSVQLPGLDSFQSPSLNRSGINLVCASFNVGASLEWLVRNKIDIGAGQGFRVYEDMNAARGDEFFKARAIRPSSRGGHNWFEQAVPGEKYFKTNPEFFVMLDGKRQWTPDGRVQRCFSNPTVQQLCKDYVLKTTLEGREFGFSAEDAAGNYCHCPKCIEMGTADGKFTTSNLYHRLFSSVAKHVIERNPKAQLVAAAYSEYRDPPTAKDVSYDPDHVMIDICTHQRCYVHTFDDPSCEPNKGQYQMYLDWMKICPNIKFYDYIDCANSMYAPWEYVMAKDFKRFAENKNAGWVDECPPPYAGYVPALKKMYPLAPEKWFSRWQLYYVMSKLSWDASLDVDQLMADAYDKYYGKAAAPMKKYHDIRRKLWANAPGHAFYGGPTRTAYCLTVPGAADELDALLKEAETLAGDDAVTRKRIAVDKHYLDDYWKKEAAEQLRLFSAEKTIVPEKTAGAIKVDGDLSEDAWVKARPINEFLTLFAKQKPEEATSVRVAYDDDNLYVGVVAMAQHAWSAVKAKADKRDGDVWADDSIEILLVPPGGDGSIYYHVVCNTKGVVYDARCAGSAFDKSYDSKCEVKVVKSDDRYVYEFKLPLAPMGAKIEPGQQWGMHFVRGCTNLQPPKTNECASIDGTVPHSPMNFRKAVFAANAARNGGFDVLVPVPAAERGNVVGDKMPKDWGCRGGVEIVDRDGSGNCFVRLKDKTIYQLLAYESLAQSPAERKIDIAVDASGSGELCVDIYRYSDATDPLKPGYTRKFLPTVTAAKFKLDAKPTRYKTQYTIKPNEWIGLAFRAEGVAEIDNVMVLPGK